MKEGNPVKLPEFKGENAWERFGVWSDWIRNYTKEHDCISFQVADGMVHYEYNSKTKTLHYIPNPDEYDVPAALIRGLTKKEVETMVRQLKLAAQFFHWGDRGRVPK